MASERKTGKAMKIATSEIAEEERKPSLLPQSMGRKLLRAANRELDFQAKVSKGLIP